MVLLGAALFLAIVVVPAPWGVVLVAAAIVWEVAEKAFWFRWSRRIPVAVGPEAMIGLPVTVVSPCAPEGRVQLFGERWQARCEEGAGVGERLVIEAVEQTTLVVATPHAPFRT
jgi:membrane protein implicated in regulation of membrane protease activity